jgi:hypothetical protein
MPNILSDLSIDEISLVDEPACQERDPVTGRKIRRAVVAIYKRDSGPTNNTEFKKEQPTMEFEQILKGAITREQVCEVVRKHAVELAREQGCSIATAEAAIWKRHPSAYEAYESSPLPVARQQAIPLAQVTEAEVELDKRARQVMKRDNIGYPQAASKVLVDDPSLYTRYCEEVAAGQTVTAPDPAHSPVEVDYFMKRAAEAEADSVCANCDAPVESDHAYCPTCGSDLSAQRETAKSKAKAKAQAKKRP